jgi:hypothetical protein
MYSVRSILALGILSALRPERLIAREGARPETCRCSERG